MNTKTLAHLANQELFKINDWFISNKASLILGKRIYYFPLAKLNK